MTIVDTPAVIATANRIGVPRVKADCWVIAVRPVARPCSSSGRPDVTATVQETMTSTCPNPQIAVAMRIVAYRKRTAAEVSTSADSSSAAVRPQRLPTAPSAGTLGMTTTSLSGWPGGACLASRQQNERCRTGGDQVRTIRRAGDKPTRDLLAFCEAQVPL